MPYVMELFMVGYFVGFNHGTDLPSFSPTIEPTIEPSMEPTIEPTILPSPFTSKFMFNDILSHPLFIFFVSWFAVVFIIFMCAVLYQFNVFKSCCTVLVDNTYTCCLIIIGIQIWDIITDAYLCSQIKHEYDESGMNEYFILFIGSIVFLVIPYILNVLIASCVTKIKVIEHNKNALQYMHNHGSKYICLTLMTGGSIPVLRLLSSNIFGLVILTSGLTQHELQSLQKFHIYSNIILQNIPQIIIQVCYIVFLNRLDAAAIFAFSGSILNILVTLFQICTSCHCLFSGEYVSYELYLRNIKQNYQLSHDYKHKINKHRWRRNDLSKTISKELELNSKKIEIGYIYPTLNGIFIHIVHGISMDDISKIQLQFSKQSMSSVSALLQCLYTFHSQDIIHKICQHFEFEHDDDFKLEFISQDIHNNINTNIINNDDAGGDTEITNLILQKRNDNNATSNKENITNIDNIDDDSHDTSDTSNDDMIHINKA